MSEIQEVKKKEKVCIVGCSDSKSETPFHLKDEFEFWGVNNLFLTMPGPWTRWFEIHQITCEGGKWLRRGKEEFRGQAVPDYLTQLGKLPFPVYCQQPNPFMPNAVAFPFKQIIDRFGTYFTNTISWQIAYAILEDFKEIRIYGVDMAVDSEYFWQRPSCEYFLGLAVGMGIKIWLPDTCDLLKTRFMYGYEEAKELPFRAKIESMKKSMQKRANQAQAQMAHHEKQVQQYIGAMSAVNEIDKIWKNVTGG
jgi:hypothetical protein